MKGRRNIQFGHKPTSRRVPTSGVRVRALARLAAVFLWWGCSGIALAETRASEKPATPLEVSVATTKSGDNYVGILERLVFTEAFARLKVRPNFVTLNMPRVSAELTNGEVDVQVPRSWEYGAMHPELIRVNETVWSISFALYSGNPGVQAKKPEELPLNLFVEYRRDVNPCKKTLAAVFSEKQVSDVLSTRQGLLKLAAGRTDIFCDVEPAVMHEILVGKRGEFSRVRKVLKLGNDVPLYVYVSNRNGELAERLAAVFRQMKSDGTIERYKAKARRSVEAMKLPGVVEAWQQ